MQAQGLPSPAAPGGLVSSNIGLRSNPAPVSTAANAGAADRSSILRPNISATPTPSGNTSSRQPQAEDVPQPPRERGHLRHAGHPQEHLQASPADVPQAGCIDQGVPAKAIDPPSEARHQLPDHASDGDDNVSAAALRACSLSGLKLGVSALCPRQAAPHRPDLRAQGIPVERPDAPCGRIAGRQTPPSQGHSLLREVLRRGQAPGSDRLPGYLDQPHPRPAPAHLDCAERVAGADEQDVDPLGASVHHQTWPLLGPRHRMDQEDAPDDACTGAHRRGLQQAPKPEGAIRCSLQGHPSHHGPRPKAPGAGTGDQASGPLSKTSTPSPSTTLPASSPPHYSAFSTWPPASPTPPCAQRCTTASAVCSSVASTTSLVLLLIIIIYYFMTYEQGPTITSIPTEPPTPAMNALYEENA